MERKIKLFVDLYLIIHLVPLEKLENMRQENGYIVFKKKLQVMMNRPM